ncbi:MAG: gamma-glutamyltransferase [Gammaproteobacteria bacterium]|nr:MAG: gamma-glutamyltransferase [Gammaproteobacteria bacterium]
MTTAQTPGTVETWTLRKPAVQATGGLIASQHYTASDIGARVLAEGGNAVDAAVAAGMAIGTVEPWMSGLGGAGVMLVYRAADRRAFAVDFPMRAPCGLDPRDYPLSGGTDADLFGWPAVGEDRNVTGPFSFAVPGFVAGLALALERFGTRSWADSLAPAIASARAGFAVDWYATLKIAAAARALAGFPESARVYLHDGFVPAGQWGGPLPRITLGNLAQTLERLAHAGPGDFYTGDVAQAFIADCAQLGSTLSPQDLAQYRARVLSADVGHYRGAGIYTAPGLTAGPSLQRTLAMLQRRPLAAAAPGGQAYLAYADCLLEAYRERLAQMGDQDEERAPSCTTHLSVVDRQGNMVSLTQTLLSVFGSKVVLPQTGVLMNNGIMWFDPRPGRPNSIAPGKRPLSNLCPTIVERDDNFRIALGASGGRRILSAVCQLISFLLDFNMTIEQACHQPRIDVSGASGVCADDKLPSAVVEQLAARHELTGAANAVYPALFACPNIVAREQTHGLSTGGAYVMSPWAKVSAQDERE